MIQFSKYFKFCLLILVSVAFLLPGLVRAQDNLPTIDLVGGGIYGLPGKPGDEISLSLRATDDKNVAKIEINWADGADWCSCVVGINRPCDNLDEGDKNCSHRFAHTYRASGEYTIEYWSTDTVSQESEHEQRIITITPEGEERVGISVAGPLSGVTGRPILAEVAAWHTTGITKIFVRYDDEASDRSETCPGDPGQCIRTFTKTYSDDQVGTRGGKAWALSGDLKSYEYPFSYEIIKSERPPENGTGPGLIQITNPLSATDFKDFIDKLVKFLFTICLIVVPILLVVAGIMFVTSQGDPEKARKAKKMILFTLIGFAIISLARIFVSFIEQIFK